MALTKTEKENMIISRIQELIEYNNEDDERQRETMQNEIACGGDPELWKDQFFYNGYIYTSQLVDVISGVLFGHGAHEKIAVDGKYKCWSRYANVLSKEEQAKVDRIITAMVNANIIKFSKSKLMVTLNKNIKL